MQDCANTQASDFSGANVKHMTKAALGGLAGCALILGATQAASGEVPATTRTFSDQLVDLDTADALTTGALDSATAVLKVRETPNGTLFSFRVTGIAADYEGVEFAAHLHNGGCVLDTPLAAGGHFQDTTLELAYPQNEVWFSLVPNEDGVAVDQTWVPFVPIDNDDTPGVMSIVIHEPASAPIGAPGGREVCLPVEVADWAP